MKKVCSKMGCCEVGAFVPVIQVFTSPKACPAEARMELQFCEPCARALTIADLITDAQWERLCFSLSSKGYPEPDRALTKAFTEPIV